MFIGVNHINNITYILFIPAMSTHSRIDLRLLQQFGLSMNTKKMYTMKYDPCTWTLMGVYERRDSEQEGESSSLVYNKGVFEHLSVWDVLNRLCNDIQEEAYMSLDDFDDMASRPRRKLPESYQKNKKQVLYQNDYVLSRIHPKLHAYPEHMETICDFVKI